MRQFLLQLWNTYAFYVLYANANGIERDRRRGPSDDRSGPLGPVAAAGDGRRSRERLDDFDATMAGRAMQAFVDELSNWYVRRSRRRFWDGDPAAFATLRECLVTVAKLLAPFMPVRRRRDLRQPRRSRAERPLSDFPVAGTSATASSSRRWRWRAETVRLGLAARGQAKLKVRQPLRAAVVVATGAERDAIERLGELVREELNVRELQFVSEADELGEVEVKPNYRTPRPAVRQAHAAVAAAVAGLIPPTSPRRCATGGRWRSRSAGTTTSSPPTICSSR